MNGRKRGKSRRMNKGDPSDGGELLETGSLVIAPQGALCIEIDRQQDRDEQPEESEAEFPEKIKPHGFQTNTPRRGRSSSARDFRDRIRFFPAGGGRKHPRCAE